MEPQKDIIPTTRSSFNKLIKLYLQQRRITPGMM